MHNLRRISFWVGIAAAAAIPTVPSIYHWLYPAKEVKAAHSFAGLAVFALDILGAIGDGILVMLWISGFAALAVSASLVAFSAAWVGRESRRTKIQCWLPSLLAVLCCGVVLAMSA